MQIKAVIFVFNPTKITALIPIRFDEESIMIDRRQEYNR